MQHEDMTDRDLEELQTAQLQQIARWGEEIEQRLAGDPALKWVLAQAERQKKAAINALVEADPTDVSEVVKHQTTIRAANMIGGWIVSVVKEGQQAAAQLQSDDAVEE
jgi:hypothetical protein